MSEPEPFGTTATDRRIISRRRKAVDGRFPLYLTCALPGGAVRPHNHGAWAVVAGLDRCEEDFFYGRVQGGHEAPHSDPFQVHNKLRGRADIEPRNAGVVAPAGLRATRWVKCNASLPLLR